MSAKKAPNSQLSLESGNEIYIVLYSLYSQAHIKRWFGPCNTWTIISLVPDSLFVAAIQLCRAQTWRDYVISALQNSYGNAFWCIESSIGVIAPPARDWYLGETTRTIYTYIGFRYFIYNFGLCVNALTLLVQRPDHSERTMPIPWLLIAKLRKQPWKCIDGQFV